MSFSRIHLVARLAVLATACVINLPAQTFSSGSTGADGALNLSSGCCGATLQLPASGVFNFTTINIPSGWALTILPNATNTPVTMLASGAVTMGGTINISAFTSNNITVPGPGGYYGGATGQNGLGPGGGQAGGTAGAQNGKWAGSLNLVPIVGGSGGAGLTSNSCSIVTGGAGGGAIVLASSTSISITSNGGITANGSSNICSGTGAGNGSGGAIRLVSNSINVTGSLQAAMVRLEAPPAALVYAGSGTAPVLSAINPTIVPVNPPSLAISSIGGYQAPSATAGSWRTVDLLLPSQLPDPITVVVQGSNVPVGSQVSLTFSGSAPLASPSVATLSGTTASSSATFSVSGLSRGAITVIFATTTFNTSQLSAGLRQTGPDAVEKVVLAAALGRPPQYRFLRKDGSEVEAAKLSAELRRMFGL